MKVGQWLGEGPSRIALYGRRHMGTWVWAFKLKRKEKKLYMIVYGLLHTMYWSCKMNLDFSMKIKHFWPISY